MSASRSNLEEPMKLAKILALAAFLIHPAASLAASKPVRWTAGTSPVHPLVRAFGCPNHFAASFPGFDWLRVSNQARTAANTWFTEGNADLSLAVARLIAETYGGEVSAASERDKVALRLSLPLGAR